MGDLSKAQTSINPSKNDAYLKGYNDYWKYIKFPPISIFHPDYDSVIGEETAYDDGWKQAESEHKESEVNFLLSMQ
jgi:hypothetical protein